MNNLSVLLVLLGVVVFFGYSIYLDIQIYRKLREYIPADDNDDFAYDESFQLQRQVQNLQNKLDKSQADVQLLTARVASLESSIEAMKLDLHFFHNLLSVVREQINK
jgi:peptidoglycan hydrolase CwlO-like protein